MPDSAVPEDVKRKLEEKQRPYEFDAEELKNRGFKTSMYKDAWDDVQKDYDKYIKGFNLNQFDDEIEKNTKNVGIKINKKNIHSTVNGLRIEYEGDNEFVLHRTFRKGVVDHDFFTIADNLQGGGFSKDVFKSLYKQYQNVGIERINVHANLEVGGYTWAKYGFSALAREYTNIDYLAHRKLNSVDYDDFSRWLSKCKGKDIPLHEVSKRTYFKDMMLGSDWHGYINLADQAQKDVFENYLFKR